MRVVAFESRRAVEMAELLRRQGMDPFVAPSVREVGLEENPAALEFARRLLAGEFDAVICLTGVGVRQLANLLNALPNAAAIQEAMKALATIARGPKPAQALRELGLGPTEVAKDPSTYLEVLEIVSRRPERKLAVQEYGRPDERLLEGLAKLGSQVFRVPVYQWALPENIEPLREAVRLLARGDARMAAFTSSVQLEHLERVAKEMDVDVLSALKRIPIASIGPTMSEALRTKGIEPCLEAAPPKLGVLVQRMGQYINEP